VVAEQAPAFPEVFIIGIDTAADVAVRIRPRAGLDVDAGADETEGRAALEGLDQGAFGLVVEDGVAGEFTKGSELEQKRPGLGGVRLWIANLAGVEIHIHVRKTGG
jgi:hypothetical protein